MNKELVIERRRLLKIGSALGRGPSVGRSRINPSFLPSFPSTDWRPPLPITHALTLFSSLPAAEDIADEEEE